MGDAHETIEKSGDCQGWGVRSMPEDRVDAAQRSRRNLIRIGAIAGPAALASLATAKRAAAVCAAAVGCRCFLKGTRIRTLEGDREVERLVAGDMLPTVFGGARPVRWVGQYRFRKLDPSRPWVEDILPIHIAPSALGLGVPDEDLYVTKSHAVLIEGVLVPAESLVNGTTITLCDARQFDELEYFHVKLASHDVIYAEGAPCETLRSVDERAVNFAEYFRQYGLPAGEDTPCAPVLSFNGRRMEIASRFRSALSPWIDRRRPLDVVRDSFEERGIVRIA
jgi:hypothetical protein